MRKLWGILCIAALCVIFGTMAGWHEHDTIMVDEQQNMSAGGENGKKVAITFDDGPHPVYTKKLLDGMKARGIVATFFVIGENAQKYPELIEQMAEDGHLVGNHTYHHVQLNAMKDSQACDEVIAANQVLEEITGETPLYLRPPFGEWSRKKDCPADMISVYWDIDPLDWKTEDASVVAQRILKDVRDGDIILLHDVYESSVEAAFLVMDELSGRGYEFVTVEDIFFN